MGDSIIWQEIHLVLVVLQLIFLIGWILRNKKKSAGHIKVKAVIVTSEVVETPNENRKPSYHAKIEYEYELNDQTYRCDTVMAEGKFQPRKTIAEGVKKHYPVGKRLAAYVDPANPADAFLESYARNAGLGMTLVGIMFGIAIIPLLVIMIISALK